MGLALLAAAAAPAFVGAQSAAPVNSGFRARDPGVRGGPPGAGGPIGGLTTAQGAFFTEGLARFNEVDAVANGLGPRFNLDSCAGCHAFPAVGGSSPATNPQVAVAGKAGATNVIPAFITSNGPVREARFKTNLDGSQDGGVHDLFTIAGRSDAPSGCTASVLQQPNFGAQLASGNVIFRIPTPTFGAGLIESITDDTIVENVGANASTKSGLGISGSVNREGNAGTVTRFGWKAQNKSLMIFGGEAYLVEQGVSNELFPQERGEPGDRGISQRVEPNAGCTTNGTSEDVTNFTTTPPEVPGPGTISDVEGFALFMAMTAPPTPSCQVSVNCSSSINDGFTQFNQIGCGMCHTPSMTTGKSSIGALSAQRANLFSDLVVHNMGSGLSDGVSQGGAGPTEFRTAPLWGLGQRIFLLHDGRSRDLGDAIQQHSSQGSEANKVIQNFNGLNEFEKQNLFNFLRSL
jgi:CxxC motif-containing protein (DUF1111 family)